MRLVLLVICAFCSSFFACQQKTIFKVQNIENQSINIEKLRNSQPCILLMLSVECPLSQKYVLSVNRLMQEYPDIPVFGIFTKWETLADMQQFQTLYQPDFPLFLDTKNKLLRAYQASITPECFLLDAQGALIYHGAIDNQFYALGRSRPAATERYLANAINALICDEVPPTRYVAPVGCVVEW